MTATCQQGVIQEHLEHLSASIHQANALYVYRKAQQSHAHSVNLPVHLTMHRAPHRARGNAYGQLLCRDIVPRTGLNARYPVRNCAGPCPIAGEERQCTSCERSLATPPLQRY